MIPEKCNYKMSHKHTVFTMNSALFSKTSVFTMNYAHFSLKTVSSSKTTVFTMNYALFFKNHSFYNELYTVWLGAILGPFWHREGSMPEPSRADRGRAMPIGAGPCRDGPRTTLQSQFSHHRAALFVFTKIKQHCFG